MGKARLLLALILLAACGVVHGQNTCVSPWCVTGVAMTVNGAAANSVPAGGVINITVSFSTSVAMTGATLGASIWDPTKIQIPNVGIWQTGVSFAANQTLAAQSFNFTAPATPGTYTVAAGAWNPDGTTGLWDGAAQTFAVTAPPAGAPVASPTCYPPAAAAFSSTLTASAPATAPAFIETWFCPDPAGKNGYVGNGFYGYVSELVPNWSALWVSWIFAPKATLDAAWKAYASNNDQELRPLEQAQLANTWPPATAFLRGTLPAPVTTGSTVYYVVQQANKFVAIPVGTAPVGTACDMTQSVDGMNGVARSSVTWYGSVKPLAVVAPCG